MSPQRALRADVPEGPDTFEFRTADGVHSPEEFRDAELALLDALWGRGLGSLLVVQANYGVVGTVLAHTARNVRMTETSARKARLCRTNADRNDAPATVSLSPSPADLDEPVDTCCYAPHEYTPVDVGKQRLVDALSTLRPGGRCVLAGRPTGGLNRYEQCLDRHCNSVETISKAGDIRVLAGTLRESVSPSQHVEYNHVTASVDGTDLSLVTAPGLFSPTELDDGTRHLLETATIKDGERVLDLCCGCGPIGAYAASVADADVVLSDDDVRATACARRTLDATGVEGTVVTSDCTRQVEGPFDRVLCNPPTHAGTGVLDDLFAGVSDVLAAGGTLAVVHHRNLDLSEYLSRVGSVVERVDGATHTVVTVET